MSLHDRIMNIRLTEEAEIWPAEERIIYKTGNRDARHAAAEMASEADELMGSLVAALGECQDALDANGRTDDVEYAQTVLDEYRRWRDS